MAQADFIHYIALRFLLARYADTATKKTRLANFVTRSYSCKGAIEMFVR